MTYQPQNNNLITGVLTGCAVTLNADPTKYDISAGLIIIDDWSTPNEHRMNILTYAGVTGQIPPNPTTSAFTTVSLEASATEGIAQLLEKEGGGAGASSVTRRDEVGLSALIHAAGDGVISSISTDVQLAYWGIQTQLDMEILRGGLNTGNIISANGTNLNIDRSAGTTSKPYFNAGTDNKEPVTITNASDTAFDFIYQRQPGVTFLQFGDTIDPDNYDDDGTITALSNNRWTIQRVYFFGQTPSTAIMYGQNVYNSQGAAIAAINLEIFVEPPNAVDGIWIASLVLKKGTTDISDTGENIIIQKSFT